MNLQCHMKSLEGLNLNWVNPFIWITWVTFSKSCRSLDQTKNYLFKIGVTLFQNVAKVTHCLLNVNSRKLASWRFCVEKGRGL